VVYIEGQTYVGTTTIVGAPMVAALQGFTVFEVNGAGSGDAFRLAEQRDEDGDVVRVTPWDHQRTITVEFYPTTGDLANLEPPTPMSKVTIAQRVGPPLPKMFVGEFRLIGATANLANRGLMTMTLTLKRWNPLYGRTITPTP